MFTLGGSGKIFATGVSRRWTPGIRTWCTETNQRLRSERLFNYSFRNGQTVGSVLQSFTCESSQFRSEYSKIACNEDGTFYLRNFPAEIKEISIWMPLTFFMFAAVGKRLISLVIYRFTVLVERFTWFCWLLA